MSRRAGAEVRAPSTGGADRDGPACQHRREIENIAAAAAKSGWAGIRTQGTRKGTAVFKTAAFDHSATHPTGLFT